MRIGSLLFGPRNVMRGSAYCRPKTSKGPRKSVWRPGKWRSGARNSWSELGWVPSRAAFGFASMPIPDSRVWFSSGKAQALDPRGSRKCIRGVENSAIEPRLYTPTRNGGRKTMTQIHDPAKARVYFEQKLAFTTGPVELDRMIKSQDAITVIDVRAVED